MSDDPWGLTTSPPTGNTWASHDGKTIGDALGEMRRVLAERPPDPLPGVRSIVAGTGVARDIAAAVHGLGIIVTEDAVLFPGFGLLRDARGRLIGFFSDGVFSVLTEEMQREMQPRRAW